jgi:hypothetical protein
VDDPLLVGVLDRLAHLDEQAEAVPHAQAGPVAVVGDRDAADQLHDEVRPAPVGHPGVEHLGDVRVVHEREGLALGLEPGDDLGRVHAGLDHLDGHLAADRVLLLGHEHDAHAALPDLLQQAVRPDRRARPFRRGLIDGAGQLRGRGVEEIAGPEVGGDQLLDPVPQGGVGPAGAGDVGGPVGGRRHLDGGQNDGVQTG